MARIFLTHGVRLNESNVEAGPYPLSPGVGTRLDEILDGRDDHGQPETADEDVEDAGDVA